MFMRACLRKLGLTVAEGTNAAPTLSKLHLSAARNEDVAVLIGTWHEAGIVKQEESGSNVVNGGKNSFHLEQANETNANDTLVSTPSDDDAAPRLQLITHTTALPTSRSSPKFDHSAFFAALPPTATFGTPLLYGAVVTSTSTLLDSNTALLATLPSGFTATATTQISGRGRGTNVWVSPPGSLMFSTVLRHSLALSEKAPVVFVQYLAALAVVAGVQSYGGNGQYGKMPVKLKWPNDIYALSPTATSNSTPPAREDYVKIGGILVTSSYTASGGYTLVVGIGLNANNSAPTTSLAQLAQKLQLPPLEVEVLLASILTSFEKLYTRFTNSGWDAQFESLYYGHWLHTNQIVTLEAEGGVRARIKGISRDWGLLLAEGLRGEGMGERGTGEVWRLQSDSNSFDFFKGLLRRKV